MLQSTVKAIIPLALWVGKTPAKKPCSASISGCHTVLQWGDVPGMEHTHGKPSFFNSTIDFFEKIPLCTSLERHFSDIGHKHVTVSQSEEVPWPALQKTAHTLNCFNFQTQVLNSYKQHHNSLKNPKSLLRALQVCCGLTLACHYNLKGTGWLWNHPSHNPSKIHTRVNCLEMIVTETWQSQLWTCCPCSVATELGTPLKKEHSSPCPWWMSASCWKEKACLQVLAPELLLFH